MTQVYKNNVVSVIGTPLNTLMSTITVFVNTGNDFPALAENEFFLATLIGIDGEGKENRWEVVKVIERNGDDLIVQRGQDNTTAQQWATGTRIELRVTAAGMERGETAYMWGNHAEQGYLKGQSGDDLFLTKEEADALYLSPEWGDELFLTEAEADELFLTAAEGDELFLTQDEADDLYTEEAPTSGLVYGRANGDWVAIDPGEGGGSGGGGGAGTINLKYDDITPNGGDTYTLAIGGEPKESLGATNLLVSVNGTIQESGEAYTTSGTDITFSENLTSNDVIDFVVELTNGSYWTQEGLNLSYDGPGTKVIADQLQVKDTAQFDADVNVTGNVTAAKFIGDGSELDNLPDRSQWVSNGDDIYYSDGNVGINGSASYSLTVDDALGMYGNSEEGTLSAMPGKDLLLLARSGQALKLHSGSNNAITLDKDSNAVIPNSIYFDDYKSRLFWNTEVDELRVFSTGAFLLRTGGTVESQNSLAVDELGNGDFRGAVNAGSSAKIATVSVGGLNGAAFWNQKTDSGVVLSNNGGTLAPSEDDARDLGAANNRWRNLWSTGNLYGGSVSVGNGTFSGIVNVGNIDQDAGARLYDSGIFYVKRASADDVDMVRIIAGDDITTKIKSSGDAEFIGTVTAGEIKVPRSRDGAFSGAFGPSPTDDTAVALKNNGGTGSSITLTANNTAEFSGSVHSGTSIFSTVSMPGTTGPGLTGSTGVSLVIANNGNGLRPSTNGAMDIGGSGNQFNNAYLSGSVMALRVVQDGAPVVDAKGLIKTLTTLRKATMDDTQDIRESLRSAIDELVAGFEQEIAAMPAPELEIETMPVPGEETE